MVIWSVLARNDLKNIHDYIAKDSKFYAIKITQEFIEKSEMLEQFPKMGRVVPEIDNKNIRELIYNSYRLLYKLSPNRIEVLAIIHGKQNFSKSFDSSENL